MNRSTALLVSTVLLVSCSSEDEVLYAVTDGKAVIEAEAWTYKQDSAKLSWRQVTSADTTSAAQLNSRDATLAEPGAAPVAVATAHYDVEVSVPNLYYFWVRARVENQDTSALDDPTALTLALTTNNANTYWQINGFSDQWQWIAMDTDQNMLSASITTGGIYELAVAANSTNLLVDKIVLTDQPGYIPVDTGPAATNTNSDTDSSPSDDDAQNQSDDTTTPTEQNNGNAHNNMSPVVTISGETSIAAGEPLVLTAIAENVPDNETIYFYWDQTLGDSVAKIETITSQTPTVTFDSPGTYVIHVTAATDAGYSNASITITVTDSTTDQSGNTNNDSSNEDNNNEDSTANIADQNIGSAHQWRSASAQGAASARHETSGVAVDGKMYVIGGRGHQLVDVYDAATNTWSQAARPPMEMHHFQAVAIDHIIYVVGAATCCFPVETNIANIYQFDTISGSWSKGAAIPANRLRGSTAAAVYNRKIYIVGGNTRGHSGGAVNWFDEFDPATGQWRALADAPDARDHATIAVVGDQLVVAGGRQSDYPNTFGNTVARTNLYDFQQQRWQTAADIPTQRAGTMSVGMGSELVVIGGESPASNNAHNAVEAFNIFSRTWRRLNPLPTPRHGGAAAVLNQSIHVVTGSKQRGGGPETNAHEILK